MKKASITEAKNNLSALIDSVKGGSPVLIVDRGRPVARLEPVSALPPDDDSRLARLVRDGIVRPRRGGLPKALFSAKPPQVKKGASGVRVCSTSSRRPMRFWDASAIVPLFDRTNNEGGAGARRKDHDARVVGNRSGVRVSNCAA